MDGRTDGQTDRQNCYICVLTRNNKITCADQTSWNWLMESALRIAPVEGHRFQAIELAKLNRLNKVRMWIPEECSELLAVLTRLAMQNQGLDTSGWRLLHHQEKPEGQLLVFAVCDASLRVLRFLGGRAYLELSRVTFELPSQREDGSSLSEEGTEPLKK